MDHTCNLQGVQKAIYTALSGHALRCEWFAITGFVIDIRIDKLTGKRTDRSATLPSLETLRLFSYFEPESHKYNTK